MTNVRIASMPFAIKARAALGNIIPKMEIVVTTEEVDPVFRNQAGSNLPHLMVRTRTSDVQMEIPCQLD